MTKLLNFINNVLERSPIVIAFVLPLLFVPVTTEFYETPKIAFLIVSSALLFLLWSAKMVLEKKVALVRSPFDLPLTILALVFIIAVILTPFKINALAGSYLRFQPSLPVAIALILYFYTFAANLKSSEARHKTVLAFVLSVSLASLWGIMSFLGAFEALPDGLPVYLKSRLFNTTGSIAALSLLSALSFILALGLISETKKASWNNLLNLCLYPLTTLVIVYRHPLGLLALFFSLGFLVIFQSQTLKKLKTSLIPLGFWAALVAVAVFTPQIVTSLRIGDRPQELGLDFSTSWQITSQTLSAQPILGGGVGRFLQIFSTFKPVAFNLGQFWNVRFDRPFNEPLLYLAEMGILGLAAFLFLLFRVVKFIFQAKNQESGLSGSLKAGLFTLVLAYFFSVSGSLQNFSLILLLSLLVSLEADSASNLAERVILSLAAIKDRLIKISGETEAAKKLTVATNPRQILPYFVLVLSLTLAALGVPAVASAYLAEFFNRAALNAVGRNDGRAAYENSIASIRFNPYFDVYQRNLAQISLGVAANLSSRAEVTDVDRQTVRSLISESVNRARYASEILQPTNVANWEVRAGVYRNLIGVAQNAEAWALDAYASAVSLDPTNPNLRILLGGIYFDFGSYDLALQAFNQAVNLKPDHASAHYNLAKALIQLNRKPEAIAQYDIVLNIIGQNSPDFERATKEKDDLVKSSIEEVRQAQAAGQATGGPPAGGSTGAQELNVPTTETKIQKENVAPPPIDLGNPEEEKKEATPSSENQ